MSFWDMLSFFQRDSSFVRTLCRVLPVLWLTPHTVWTVTVVTQHTRDMPSPLFPQDRIRELCATALKRASEPECEEVLQELRKLVHERSEALRNLTAGNSETHDIRTRQAPVESTISADGLLKAVRPVLATTGRRTACFRRFQQQNGH